MHEVIFDLDQFDESDVPRLFAGQGSECCFIVNEFMHRREEVVTQKKELDHIACHNVCGAFGYVDG